MASGRKPQTLTPKMKTLHIAIILLAVQTAAFGESLHFFVLAEGAVAPEQRSSLHDFQARTKNLGSSVLDVELLMEVRLTTAHGENIMLDSQGNITEKWLTEGLAIVVKWPDGVAKRFAKITGENPGHQILIALGDRVLMAPMVREAIETDSIEITLGKTTTVEEANQIVDSLRALVPKKS
jgi:hypothetical protein